jgi:hypothetical protein
LLDVQLEVAEDVCGPAAGVGEMSGIAATKRDAVAKGLAAARGLFQLFLT